MHAPPTWGVGLLPADSIARAPRQPPTPTFSSTTWCRPHMGPSPLFHPLAPTIKRCLSPPAQVSLPAPLFPRKEHVESTPTPLASYPPSRRHHSTRKSKPLPPLQPPHGELPPSTIIVLHLCPSSLSVPPSCCRSTSRPPPATGARCRTGPLLRLTTVPSPW
jgi:hypothetical protein